MPKSKKPGWIVWHAKTNTARKMILQDLEPEGILDGRDDLSAFDVWQYYKNLPEFGNVCFNQFQERLTTHRQQAGRDRQLAHRDMKAMLHDREVYKRSGHNSRGEPVFDMSGAKLLLRQDVIDGIHADKTPSDFQRTRPEYMDFKKHIFKQRIYQEVRRKKFLHFLEIKRATETPGSPRTNKEFAARHNKKQSS